MKRLALSTILLAAASMLASGCVYKMNIQQGNYLVADSVSQLKEGMTRSQVRFLLGTPMVPDAFDDSRWDYYYFFSSRHIKQPLKRRLTVYFQDERVQRFENQGVPTKTDLEQLERDLKKAIADNKKHERKPSLWKRMTGRGGEKSGSAEPQAVPAGPKTSTEAQGQQPPDPVPPSEPAPAPAGTPSGQP
ncbi:MAG TPA: outer membrane protein assembly factor BamE [Steroidobacteraceae bacterium]|nr:outer membrane protein assembly factor BamE [Steroidobacteraceae bacterium]